MIKAIKKAYGGGFRAGMATPRLQGMANTRCLKCIVSPLNPYNNAFAARYRPLLALAWETGRIDGMMKRLTTKKG